jgi:hypothetical protein
MHCIRFYFHFYLFIYLIFSSEMSFCSGAVRALHFDSIVPFLTQLGTPAVCAETASTFRTSHISFTVISYYHRNMTTIAAADRSARILFQDSEQC